MSSAPQTPCISFEFFPPKTEAARKSLAQTLEALAPAEPDFVSVTYGAMGSTRDTTKDIVIEICRTKPFPAMAHLTCVGHSQKNLLQLLDEYAEAGVDNILALSGDPVEDSGEANAGAGSMEVSIGAGMGASGPDTEEEFKYAMQLVELIKSHPHNFCIGVAAHPEMHPRSIDKKSDRKHLAQKLELADFAITQFFFYSGYYFRMIEELGELGVKKPVIPGVIPVVNTKSIRRFSDINEVDINEELMQKLDSTPDPAKKLEIATAEALSLSQELLAGGAPGIHIYTLNQSSAPLAIAQNLR